MSTSTYHTHPFTLISISMKHYDWQLIFMFVTKLGDFNFLIYEKIDIFEF